MCNLDFLYYTMKKFLLSSQSVLSALLLSACSPGPVDGEGSGLVTNDKIESREFWRPSIMEIYMARTSSTQARIP